MKFRGIGLFLLVLAALEASETDYSKVLLRVVDATTGKPVSGVKLATEYWNDPKESFVPLVSQGTTDPKGQVVLEVYRAAYAPQSSHEKSRITEQVFRLTVENKDYQADYGESQFLQEVEQAIFSRKSDIVPSIPDYTFRILSRSERQKQEDIRKETEARDEKQAIEWLAMASDFWPPQSHDLWPSRAEQLLVTKRWKIASSKPLGSESDQIAIKAAVIANLPQGKPGVKEVRWLSDSVVIADGNWYGGSLDAGVYLYVLKKIEGRWVILRKYLQVIS